MNHRCARHTDGIKTHVAEQGEGPRGRVPAMASRKLWYSWRDRVTRPGRRPGTHAVAPDQRATGQTESGPRPSRPSASPRQRGTFVGLVAALGEERAIRSSATTWGSSRRLGTAPAAAGHLPCRRPAQRPLIARSLDGHPPDGRDEADGGREPILSTLLPGTGPGRGGVRGRRPQDPAHVPLLGFADPPPGEALAFPVRKVQEASRHRRAAGDPSRLVDGAGHRLLHGGVRADRVPRRAELVPQPRPDVGIDALP